MKALTGIVENGLVRPSPPARLRNGEKVVMVVVGRRKGRPSAPRDSRIEAEDAAFAKACRRSIKEAMRAEER
ncbi:MAG: hypothetical protein FJ291_33305 [Planctomycetes bacterium]|nr:hypothetical protein [Planctomycetota bacterium]